MKEALKRFAKTVFASKKGWIWLFSFIEYATLSTYMIFFFGYENVLKAKIISGIHCINSLILLIVIGVITIAEIKIEYKKS